MAVLADINAILADDVLDDESSEGSKCEQIERLIKGVGWPKIRDSILALLADSERRRRDYEVAAEVLWGAVLDGREMPADRVIALLYNRFRFESPGDVEENLVWSITSKLKRVGYLSEYEPLQDAGVKAELAAIRAG
ncbi:MAG: hypothetical protein WD768_06735 [Phycisphaeraceae bacterium]